MNVLPGTTGRRRIYLMRHGHVDYFAKEVQESRDTRLARLTEQGREEAEWAGKALSHVTFDMAMCSGLRRTRQTASLVLQQNVGSGETLSLEEDLRLEELKSDTYIKFESKEQLSAYLLFQYENAGKDGARYFGEGELFSDAMLRSVEAIGSLLKQPDWSTALIVAHEGINRLILSWMCHAHAGASASFEQDTGCINILDFDLVPSESDDSNVIERRIIKAVNLTPKNYVKHGMNLRSLEAIFTGG